MSTSIHDWSITITQIIAGLVALISAGRTIRNMIARYPRDRRRWMLAAVSGAVCVGITALRVAYPRPAVTVTSPLGMAMVEEPDSQKKSVRFEAAGASTGVYADNSLGIYLLVWSGVDWHIQRRATVMPNGDWKAVAWIGGPSSPVEEGAALKVVAVVSRESRGQDDTVDDVRQLNPVATSNLTTATARRSSKTAGASP